MELIPKAPPEELLTIQRKEIIQGILLLIVLLVILFGLGTLVDLENIRETIEQLGVVGPLVYIILKASTIVISPLVGAPLYLIAGPLFGFWKGFLYSMIGDILGTTAAFYLSRLYGKRIINFFFSGRLIRLIEKVLSKIEDWKGLLYSRLVLFVLHDVISYAAGLTRIRFSTFITVSIMAFIIPVALSVALGLSIIEKNILNTAIIIGLIIGILGIIYEISRRRNRK